MEEADKEWVALQANWKSVCNRQIHSMNKFITKTSKTTKKKNSHIPHESKIPNKCLEKKQRQTDFRLKKRTLFVLTICMAFNRI